MNDLLLVAHSMSLMIGLIFGYGYSSIIANTRYDTCRQLMRNFFAKIHALAFSIPCILLIVSLENNLIVALGAVSIFIILTDHVIGQSICYKFISILNILSLMCISPLILYIIIENNYPMIIDANFFIWLINIILHNSITKNFSLW